MKKYAVSDIYSLSFKNKRSKNMDKIKIIYHNSNIFAILLDGHGNIDITDTIIEYIEHFILNNFDFSNKSVVYNIIKQIDKNIYYKYSSYRNKRCGSTVTIIAILDKNIISINLGDSNYCIVTNKNYYTGITHNFNNNYDEIVRVLKMKSDHRFSYNNQIRLNSRLELSRSIGDYNYKLKNNKLSSNYIVLVKPEFKVYTISECYIMLASDGIWNYIKRKDIIENINNSMKCQQIVENIINQVLKRGSYDNLSIILIKMRKNKQ